MNCSDKPFKGYNSGADMWHDNVLSYGIDEAVIIGGNYLALNLKREHSSDERQFCRELFEAIYEDVAGKIDSAKLVYPYDIKTANERMEASYYHENRQRNADCTKGIDAIISDSCYETNFYNLEIAAMKAIVDYGFPRVNQLLAFNIQKRRSDGRFTSANRRWSETFIMPESAFSSAYLNAHSILIDSFVTYTRKFYDDLGADRFVLPGQMEDGDSEPVHGYQMIRSVMFNKSQGYVIAHNPDAVD